MHIRIEYPNNKKGAARIVRNERFILVDEGVEVDFSRLVKGFSLGGENGGFSLLNLNVIGFAVVEQEEPEAALEVAG